LFPDNRKITIFRKERAGQGVKDKRRMRHHGWA
jgi:hypothetical protein